jgi:hypothetical protein
MSEHRFRALPAPLIAKMDVIGYIRYRPHSKHAMIGMILDKERLRIERQSVREAQRQRSDELMKLGYAYDDGEFLRSPEDWEWVLPEERFPPEIRDWKQECRRHLDGGQGLSEKKRELIRSIIRPIWEDAKFTYGRARDLLEEIRDGCPNAYDIEQARSILRDFFNRVSKSCHDRLIQETDAPAYTEYALRLILEPTFAEGQQLYKDIWNAIEKTSRIHPAD